MKVSLINGKYLSLSKRLSGCATTARQLLEQAQEKAKMLVVREAYRSQDVGPNESLYNA